MNYQYCILYPSLSYIVCVSGEGGKNTACHCRSIPPYLKKKTRKQNTKAEHHNVQILLARIFKNDYFFKIHEYLLYNKKNLSSSHLHGSEVADVVKVKDHFDVTFREGVVAPSYVVVPRPHSWDKAVQKIIQTPGAICQLTQALAQSGETMILQIIFGMFSLVFLIFIHIGFNSDL